MAANYTTIYVPIAELQKRNRTSPKAQAIAKYFVENDLLYIDKTIRYDDVADALKTDPRNLKRLIDKYPGFVRLAGTSRYFYLEEFANIAQSMGMHYPIELPLNVQHSTKIPMVVPQPQHLISPVAVKITVDGIPTEMVGNDAQTSNTPGHLRSVGELQPRDESSRGGSGGGHSDGETHSGSVQGGTILSGAPISGGGSSTLPADSGLQRRFSHGNSERAEQGTESPEGISRQGSDQEPAQEGFVRDSLRTVAFPGSFTWLVPSDIGNNSVAIYGTFQPVSSDGQKISNELLAEELLSLANQVAENLLSPTAQTRDKRIQDLAALTVFANTILHHTIPKE